MALLPREIVALPSDAARQRAVQAAMRPAMVLLTIGFAAAIWIAYFPMPIFAFYKEWVYAMTLALAALVCPPAPAPARNGPAAELWLMGALGAVLLLQVATGDGLWPAAVMAAGYLALFALAHQVGQQLAAISPERFLVGLAGLLVIAALGNCVFAAVQMGGWTTDWPLVAPRSGPRIAGNTAQVNHAATLLWLGMLAAVGLGTLGVIRRSVAAALIVLFGLFIVATGSRMPLVMDLVLVMAALAVWRRSHSMAVRGAARAIALCGLAQPLLEVLWNLLGVPELLDLSSPMRRLLGGSGSSSTEVRWWLLRAAWDAVWTHPWLGVGVGRFVQHTYTLALQTGRMVPHAAEVHAHNLIAHVGAEMGLPAALATLLTVVVIIRRAWRCALDNVAGLVLAAMTAVLLVHAFLEYPLWYDYFLGSLGLLAGALYRLPGDAGARSDRGNEAGPGSMPPDPSAGHAPVVAPLVLRGLGLAMLLLSLCVYQQFAPLERAMHDISFQAGMGATVQSNDTIRRELAQVPAWSPYADYATWTGLIASVPSPASAPQMATSCDRMLRFSPSELLLSRCAIAFQLAGMPDRATALATSQCIFYPGTEHLIYAVLSLVAPKHPEVLRLKAPCLMDMTRPVGSGRQAAIP